MAGPIVRLGTKWPSITSMWSRSAPASDASRTWSPRRSKRADKIEGAILMAIEARKEASWNKISLPRDAGRGEGVSFSGVTRLGSVERCKFGDDLHPADEGHRLHDVSDLAAEPGFGREGGLPHSSPPRPTTGPSRSSVVRRSIVGSATRTGIEENVPAGVVTS